MASQQLTRLVVAPGAAAARDAIARLAAAMSGDSAVLLLDERNAAVAPNGREPAESRVTDSPDTALVIATSGSTGTPRQVELSRQALTAAAEASQAALMGPGLWLTAVPVTSIAGVVTALRSHLAGTEPEIWPGIAGAQRFPDDSFRMAVHAARHRADQLGLPCYTSLVPTQVMRLVQAGAADLLAAFDTVLVGGAVLAAGLREQLLAAQVRVVNTYGCTETGAGVVYDGLPIPGVTVDIVTEPHNVDGGHPTDEQPSAATGRVRISGPTLASGYRGNPSATAASFHDGSYLTDDLGYWQDGRLHLSGRSDDIIKTGGRKLSLLQISAELGEHPQVLEVIALPREDPEWGTLPVVIAVPVPGSDLSDDQLAAELTESLASQFRLPTAHRRVTVMTDPPLLAGGKVDRAAVLRDWQD